MSGDKPRSGCFGDRGDEQALGLSIVALPLEASYRRVAYEQVARSGVRMHTSTCHGMGIEHET